MPFIPTVLIALPSFIFVIVTLTVPGFAPVVTYISYGLSAWALTLSVTYTVRIIRKTGGNWRRLPVVVWFYKTSFGERFLSDRFFRAEIGLYSGFVLSLIYVVIKLVSGFVYGSFWFVALASYYLLLALLHMILMRHLRGDVTEGATVRTYGRARICGILMLALTPILATIVFFMVRFGRGYEYPGFLIYVMAMYAFYEVITATIGVVRAHKYNSPVFSADRVVTLAAAMVTMLSLESAMLTQFGSTEDAWMQGILISVTGAVICMLSAAMAIWLIVSATIQIKQIKRNL